VSVAFDPQALSGIYTEGYFRGERADGYADYAGSEGVLRREFRRAVAALRRAGPSGGRLLEVGCAYGFFLLEAAPFFDVTGIDVAEPAVAACRQRGLAATCGELTAEWLAAQPPFDAVVMLDVIEHLPRPFDVLRMLHGRLRQGGTLMITTGDVDSLYARASGRHWRLLTPPQHVYFFSERTLAALLQRAGFGVVACARPWKVVPVGLMLYQIARRSGLPLPNLPRLARVGLPVNLLDVVRVIARAR
jgi:SAM-dependent methyltransferase